MTCDEATFRAYVKPHEMKILSDNGLYRHVHFSNPERRWAYWFDLVTWPGNLCVRGDCGSYVFSRTSDMFNFFRHDGDIDDPLTVNLGYWAEKLQAEEVSPEEYRGRRWSPEKFEATVKRLYVEHVRENMQGMADDRKDLRRLVENDVLFYSGNRSEATAAAQNFDEFGLQFHDLWDYDFDDYTYQFEWCCYAIVWGIRMYDLANAQRPIEEPRSGDEALLSNGQQPDTKIIAQRPEDVS